MVDPVSESMSNSRSSNLPGIRKLTLSCSRCRASKLKCDRKEPCTECIKRNIEHLCSKDERRPRAKRAKAASTNQTNINESPLLDTVAEDTAEALENFIEGASMSNHASAPSSKSLRVAPDYPNLYWRTADDPQKHSEKSALVREILCSMPSEEVINHIYEIFVTRCQGPLGNVFHTPSFLAQTKTLYECLSLPSMEERVNAIIVSIEMETLACYLLALVLGLAFHPTPKILGWSSTNLNLHIEELRASHICSRNWRSLAIRCLRGQMSIFCGSIASLQAALMLLLDGREEILELDSLMVVAISGAQKLGLHRLGHAKLDTSAPSSTDPGKFSLTISQNIRTETGVRIWWALVMRDWSRAQALGYYSIHPSHTNTRMPLHVNDEDLLQGNSNSLGNIIERPRSKFTMLSYTIYAIEISTLVRESTDLRNGLQREPKKAVIEGAKMRQHLMNKYESFLANLPSHFRLGNSLGLNSTGPLAAIPVQQWMLHQQLWSLFLRLHRAGLSSNDGRASSQLLAQNIISSHAQVQSRCTVCGSLSIGDVQLFNAAAVLLIELLFSSTSNDAESSAAQLSRLMTRDKLREAVELLRARGEIVESRPFDIHSPYQSKFSAQKGVIALKALMKLEEDLSATPADVHKQGNTVEVPNVRSRTSLKTRVMEILGDLSERSDTWANDDFDMSTSRSPEIATPSASSGLARGLDVLPVLSNDPECNFWQFMDFTCGQPSSEGDFLATTEWQPFINSILTEQLPEENFASATGYSLTDTWTDAPTDALALPNLNIDTESSVNYNLY